jgi:predicted SAM-dependent methyltransferase
MLSPHFVEGLVVEEGGRVLEGCHSVFWLAGYVGVRLILPRVSFSCRDGLCRLPGDEPACFEGRPLTASVEMATEVK